MKKSQYLVVLVMACLSCWTPALGDQLDDLLNGSARGARVVESEKVKDDWASALDLLAQRKYEASLKQLENLGSVEGFVTPRRRDFIAIARRVITFPDWLESEKKDVREDYAKVLSRIRDAESALNMLEQEASSAKFRNTGIPAGTKQRIDADRKRWQESMKAASAERVRIQQQANKFKSDTFATLEQEVGRWIDPDSKGEDIETAYILSTTFLDCVGDSKNIRNLSARLQQRRDDLKKVETIVESVQQKLLPLANAGDTDAYHENQKSCIARIQVCDDN